MQAYTNRLPVDWYRTEHHRLVAQQSSNRDASHNPYNLYSIVPSYWEQSKRLGMPTPSQVYTRNCHTTALIKIL